MRRRAARWKLVSQPKGEETMPDLDLAAIAGRLVESLREAGVEFEVLPHRRTTTAGSEARVLGIPPEETAKTLIAKGESGYVRAVVPAAEHLDLAKLAAVLDGETMTLLTEAELVSAYPQFELGAVPPFGGPEGDRVVVDQTLVECAHVVLDAGVHDASIRMHGRDLVTVAHAEVAEIAKA
jgi:Ala-tRNA(Pro) deacylase